MEIQSICVILETPVVLAVELGIHTIALMVIVLKKFVAVFVRTVAFVLVICCSSQTELISSSKITA